MVQAVAVKGAAEIIGKAVVKATLVEAIRDGVVDFIAGQAKDMGKKEVAEGIAKLRSDARLRDQIQQALERATERWAHDYADHGLVAAVAENTRFADLPSVQEAIRTVAQRPFAPIAAETLYGKFDDVLPQRFEAGRVERGVAALLKFLQEEFVSVPALQQTQEVAAAIETARATGQIVKNTAALAHIEELLRQMISGPTPTQETLQDYLTWVIDQHRYLDPRGVRQTVRQVQVLLQDVYVSLTAEAEPALSASDRHLYEHELERLLARDDLKPEESEDLRENLRARYAQFGQTRPKLELIDLSDLVSQHPKLVILGDPGAGKTTLLRYLALSHAQAMRKGENEIDILGSTRLPLFLRIAEYAEHGSGRTLLDFLPTNVRGEGDSDKSLDMLIRERLATGSCLVLLDGLDEIIEPGQRAEIAAQIDAFIRTHERVGNRFVITSRVAGYRSTPLSGDIAHYRVRDMSVDQMRAFLEQWCHAVECFQTPGLSPGAQAAKACAEVDAITQAIKDTPGVRTLATNPLLLRTLALIHRTNTRIPQRRIELYRLAADTLIRDWQLARGISETALIKEAEATRMLAELAAWLHQEKPAGIAAHGEVRAKLAEVKGRLLGQDPDHPDVLDAVDDFLRRIRQHTGLFVERAPRRYGFMHLTFEEYFAARWLVARPRQAARRIRNKLHRPRWQEPILLAVAFYGMEFPDDVDDLIREAILGQDLGGPSPYEHILHRDLLFAVRCLGDQDVSADLRRKLIADFTHCWLDKDQGNKYKPLWERCAQIAQALRGSETETALIESLITTLQNKDESEDIRGRTVQALGSTALRNTMMDTKAILTLLTVLQDKNESEHIRGRAAYVLDNATTQPNVISVLLAIFQNKSESEFVRRSAAGAMINATTQTEVVSVLLATLQDKSESEFARRSVIYALRNATLTTDTVSALLVALQDKSRDVRGDAASALNDATLTTEAVSILIAVIQDKKKNEYVRVRAISALRNVTLTAEAISTLLMVFQNKNESVQIRGHAAFVLRNTTTQPNVVSTLLVALTDKSEHIRGRAASALRKATTQPNVVSALLATLTDKSEYVRGCAVSALHNATDQPDVTSALLVALTDASASVRVRAASALNNTTAQPDVLSVLLAALASARTSVRVRAALVLRNTTAQPDVISALLDALTDTNTSVRVRAASALTNLTRQPMATTLPDLPTQLLASLDLPNLDKGTWTPSGYVKPQSRLFQALSTVAPPPQLD